MYGTDALNMLTVNELRANGKNVAISVPYEGFHSVRNQQQHQ